MRGAAAVREAAGFLRALVGSDNESPGHMVIFTLPGNGVCSFPTDRVEEAARTAARLASRHEVYFGVGLQGEPPTAGRGTAATVSALPGFWMDLDLQAPYRNRTDLPVTVDEALAFLADLPLRPTAVVHSGGGLYPWWVFRELWVFGSEEERHTAVRLSRRWQQFVRTMAAKKGWNLDNTSDLARVLRLPGTLNHKGERPVPVRIIQTAGPRYVPDDFEDFVVEEEPKPPTLNRAPPPIEAGTLRRRAYIASAITRECEELAALHPDCERRNTTLNRAAFSLGRFAETGEVDPGKLADLLTIAARQCGLDDWEIAKTLSSAFSARGVPV